jgi:hypothetical protein
MIMRARTRSALFAALVVSLIPLAARAQDSTLDRAMHDELDRSIRELHLGQLARPYYIAYRVFEEWGLGATATGGSLVSSTANHSRHFDPEVRVGDYAFDNTNFSEFSGGVALVSVGGGDEGVSFGSEGLPLDESYLELRRQMWLMTDFAYKQAAESFAGKKAALVNRSRRDSLPDFSRASPTHTIDTLPPIVLERSAAESLVRTLSAVPQLAGMYRSMVTLGVGNGRMFLLNTEGTTAIVRHPLLSLAIAGATQAVDGAPISGTMRRYARSAAELPPVDQLTRDIRAFALRLDSLRQAPVLDQYSGPVLLEGHAAAELFAESFAPALVGRRAPTGGPDVAAMMEASGRRMAAFGDRLGSRVLPTPLTVIDDPTVAEYAGAPLLGSYRVDDDGVPGRRKVLVDNGIVKQVLTTRTPVHGAPESTGNRRGDGAAASNMLVTSTAAVSDTELRSRLLALVKQRGLPFGLIIRELGVSAPNHEDPMAMLSAMRGRGAGRSVLLAYRLYPDGREELVRGARLVDVGAESFRDIVAVSQNAAILHRPSLSLGGMSSFMIPVELLESLGDADGAVPMASYVVPSLLFEDLSLERVEGEQPKPPVSPPPGSTSVRQ